MTTDKTEIPMADDELQALMAELEIHTAGAVEAPTIAAAQVAAAPPPEPATSEPVAVAEPDIPKGKDPIEAEESNFIVPTSVKAITDPPAWGEEAAAPAPAPTARVANRLKVVTPTPAPEEPAVPASAAALTVESEDELEDPPAIAKPNGKQSIWSVDPFFSPTELARDTAVSDTNLDSCFMNQASLMAYYGEKAARAEAQAKNMKTYASAKIAQLYSSHRLTMILAGEKVTEKALESLVEKDPKWIALQQRLTEAELVAQLGKTAVESLKHRRDMIIQLGADRREEGKGAARMYGDEETKNRAVNAARRA